MLNTVIKTKTEDLKVQEQKKHSLSLRKLLLKH